LLPSLGVSSLDLGRSVLPSGPFFLSDGRMLAFCGAQREAHLPALTGAAMPDEPVLFCDAIIQYRLLGRRPPFQQHRQRIENALGHIEQRLA
jgi:hypothetical protein